MSRFTQPNIPPTDDPRQLQKSVVIAFQNLIQQLNNPFTDDVDISNHRIVNVAWPSLGGDAVPLDYLKKFKGKGTSTETSGREHFGIAFCGTGIVTMGDVIPAYPAPKVRTGTPSEIVLYALTAPSTSPLKMDIAIDGTSLLGSAGIVLGTGSKGPVDSTAFVARPRIKHNSVVLASILAADGVAANVTIVLGVSR